MDSLKRVIKNTIENNTSPETRKKIRQAITIAKETAKYSIVSILSLITATTGALNIMAYRKRWKDYVVEPGDTFESIGGKFNMTDIGIKRRNNFISKGARLIPGMNLKVRNRVFIEKNYLNQLRDVLQDALKIKHSSHINIEINKLFAKK